MHLALLWLVLAAPSEAPDVLVVCPAEFRPALRAWEQYRQAQGHQIAIIEPPQNAASLTDEIQRFAELGRLKHVVLIGDVPDYESAISRRRAIPTQYVDAHINTRWGSEPTIATDSPYADTDNDGIPDLAIGRIPADTNAELAVVVGKILRYESTDEGPWQRKLNVVAGAGGFGAFTDAIIEAAGRQVFQQTVPPDYDLQHILAHAAQPAGSPLGPVRGQVRNQLNAGCLAWIYMGHALPCELDSVNTPEGRAAILSVEDVPQLQCSAQCPLAVLVACYTGAIDATSDCLAEELALAAEGPVAAIAATRVTMPYGNTVLGYELLQACFKNRQPTLGEALLAAQRKTLQPVADDPMRKSLDSMCCGISPPPVDLAAERREHVQMYHILGDPLLRVRYPALTAAVTLPTQPTTSGRRPTSTAAIAR
jgi:hypothetical protein